MVDKWHQHAGQIVKDVLSHKRVKQEDFAKYLQAVVGGKEGTDGKDSFRNLLRRGTVTLTMFLHALKYTGAKMPPGWERAGKYAVDRMSSVIAFASVPATLDSLDDSLLSDPTALHLLKQIQDLPPSDRLEGGLKLAYASEFFYRVSAADIALREMSRVNDDFVQLARKLRQSSGRRITARTLRRVFESGDLQLALLLECLCAVRSPSLERYIDMEELDAAARESLAQRSQSPKTSDQ
ncbi:hypothetical protein QCE49_12545 [Caballeronia sp. LZ008]|uniref:hypothetical protein n=1 Tax=unclassified Caballeronia TaxID=2646786 RepID=UPI0020278F9D|nr:MULTISPECIES: hypothetical protein [unclassified Caballeronia]MDR5794201.1 hypothetical protein [Caballeronia sp. LZ008]